MQRRRAVGLGGVDVGLLLQQRADGLSTTALDRVDQADASAPRGAGAQGQRGGAEPHTGHLTGTHLFPPNHHSRVSALPDYAMSTSPLLNVPKDLRSQSNLFAIVNSMLANGVFCGAAT